MAIDATSIGEKESFERQLTRLKTETEKKHGKTVEQLYEERVTRVRDAIEMRVPDRVPVTMQTGVFAARYAGVPLSTMYYDHGDYRDACLKTLLDFEPDSASVAAGISGPVNDLLDVRTCPPKPDQVKC
ncbi:MAG: hypothetical protein QGI51_01435 [Dehalococcoidales bacterium]|jgi:hypothetical protein|nr:hypothetical protein [Dehalococcoidales bacterium]